MKVSKMDSQTFLAQGFQGYPKVSHLYELLAKMPNGARVTRIELEMEGKLIVHVQFSLTEVTGG